MSSFLQNNVEQWRLVFFIAAAFYLVGNALFIIFGSGEVQEWNDPSAKKRRNSESSKEKHIEAC